MLADAIKQLFQVVFPVDELAELASRFGVQKRVRHLELDKLLIALVLNGGTSEAGRLAAVGREYVRQGGRKVAPSAFYRRFDEQFLKLMAELEGRLKAYVAVMP